MKKNLKVLALPAAAFLSLTSLVGCATGDTKPEVTNSLAPDPDYSSEPAPVPTTVPGPEPTETNVNPGNSGGLNQMLPPVIVEENQTEVTVKVGDFLDIVVSDPEATKLEVDNTGILSITQGYSDGSAVFNPGAQALSAGNAVLIIQNENTPPREVNVTVTEN